MLAVALSFLGFLHPAFDTIAHLRLHLASALFCAFVVLIFSRFKAIAVAAMMIGAVGIYSALSGLQLSAAPKSALADKPIYKMLHLNLLWNHDYPADVVEEIIKYDADLVSLAEASRNWVYHLLRLERIYPHGFNCPETGKRGGVRVYSKWPLVPDQEYCADYGVYGSRNFIAPDGDTITVGSLHLRWPWPASGPRQLDAILPEVKTLGPDVLIAGDFNATTWSHALKKFANAGGLNIVPGIGPTWFFEEFPGFIAGWVGLPIDNVTYKGRVRILEVRRLPHVGSDHFPILVSFQIE